MNKFRTVGQLDRLSPLNGYPLMTTELTTVIAARRLAREIFF